MKINGIVSNISLYGNTFKRKRIHCKIVNNYIWKLISYGVCIYIKYHITVCLALISSGCFLVLVLIAFFLVFFKNLEWKPLLLRNFHNRTLVLSDWMVEPFLKTILISFRERAMHKYILKNFQILKQKKKKIKKIKFFFINFTKSSYKY